MTKQIENSFPAAWIVLAALAPFIAFAGLVVAGQSGVRMTIHDPSLVGQFVSWLFVAVAGTAVVIESGAVFVGIRAMWKSPQARSIANALALAFGIVSTSAFVAFATVPSGSWPW
jgi:hypothetical protein